MGSRWTGLKPAVICWGKAEMVNFSYPSRRNKGLKPLAAQQSTHGGIRVLGETTTSPKPLAAQRSTHSGIRVLDEITTPPNALGSNLN
jgi:hypothetical protein